jgi:hypothetical protein
MTSCKKVSAMLLKWCQNIVISYIGAQVFKGPRLSGEQLENKLLSLYLDHIPKFLEGFASSMPSDMHVDMMKYPDLAKYTKSREPSSSSSSSRDPPPSSSSETKASSSEQKSKAHGGARKGAGRKPKKAKSQGQTNEKEPEKPPPPPLLTGANIFSRYVDLRKYHNGIFANTLRL